MQRVFFFNDTATTEIYTLSLHDALPICNPRACQEVRRHLTGFRSRCAAPRGESAGSRAGGRARNGAAELLHRCRRVRSRAMARSEEHTSELQSRQYLVCRLLLEKKIYTF